MSDQNTSTLQSYANSASSAINSAVGAVTGNPADKAAADRKHADAQVSHDASHATAKLGPYTTTAEGGIAKDDPNRTAGSWNQSLGSLKEGIGGLTGVESLKQAGAEQNAAGKEQEAQGQLSDLGKGVGDRVQGSVGGVVAGLTGDREGEARYKEMHDSGKAAQRGVEADLQKQADAQERSARH